MLAPVTSNFNCYLEELERFEGKPLGEINKREIRFKLKDKYVCMFLYDEGDDGDGSVYKEHRKIIEIEWVNRRGWQVVTQVVGEEDDAEKNQGYMVNSTLPPLIKAGKNPGVNLVLAPAGAAGAANA